jgi:F0F1-type ATP synthase assembly protein I
MCTRQVAVLALAAALLIAVPAAQAITFSEPDGSLRPNVGALIVLLPDGTFALSARALSLHRPCP